MSGYGRGYYGDSQLDPQRSSSSWGTVAVVAGLGVLAWFMLPSIGPRRAKDPQHAPQPQAYVPPAPPPPPLSELARMASDRGFSSIKDYEDAVLADARELRASGARVDLGPHLQHLESRLNEGFAP